MSSPASGKLGRYSLDKAASLLLTRSITTSCLDGLRDKKLEAGEGQEGRGTIYTTTRQLTPQAWAIKKVVEAREVFGGNLYSRLQ